MGHGHGKSYKGGVPNYKTPKGTGKFTPAAPTAAEQAEAKRFEAVHLLRTKIGGQWSYNPETNQFEAIFDTRMADAIQQNLQGEAIGCTLVFLDERGKPTETKSEQTRMSLNSAQATAFLLDLTLQHRKISLEREFSSLRQGRPR